MVRALIFDYNQVLADDFKAHKKAYAKTFKRYGLKINEKELEWLLNKGRKEKISYLQKNHGLKEHEKMFEEKEKEFLEIAKNEDLLFPGTEKALEELSKQYKIAVFTGTNKEQMFLPEKVLGLFSAMVTVKDYSKPKPHPEGLLLCIKKLRIKAEECAYIGDQPTDMIAAKSAGCKPIGMAAGTYNAEELRKSGAEIVITEINQLLEIRL